MKNLEVIFEGVKHPSVRIFNERIACYSPEEQREYYHEAFRQTLHGFNRHSKRFQAFFRQLVHTHRQEYLDFLHETTILGGMRYRLSDKELFRKVVCRMEGVQKDLMFSLLLSFNYKLKISTLQQYMKTDLFDPADLADLLEKLG
jgi:hypothetical protein